ncbi:MAG: TIM barrel protein [Candidatus Woesearchaeota archaeon]
MKIQLGTAGSPCSSSLEGIKVIRDSGLQAMEVEFVRGVNMSNATAKEVGRAAEEEGIRLSIHAPYYISLNSTEKAKVQASIGRILQSCERGHHLGAKYIVFHPGYYGKMDAETTFQNMKTAIVRIQSVIEKRGWDVKLAPETTGKVNVFGNMEETLRLVKETKCHFCVDFAHLKAREGSIDYSKVLDKLSKFRELHCHFSGIEFSDKGEKRHILCDKKEATMLAKAMLKHEINATIINESPDPLGDSIMMRDILLSSGYKFA